MSFHSVQTPQTGRAQVWYHGRCGSLSSSWAFSSMVDEFHAVRFMEKKLTCDPLVERKQKLPGRPRGHDKLCNLMAMRVQVPPSRCWSDSISPRSATGPQGPEAGRNGGA